MNISSRLILLGATACSLACQAPSQPPVQPTLAASALAAKDPATTAIQPAPSAKLCTVSATITLAQGLLGAHRAPHENAVFTIDLRQAEASSSLFFATEGSWDFPLPGPLLISSVTRDSWNRPLLLRFQAKNASTSCLWTLIINPDQPQHATILIESFRDGQATGLVIAQALLTQPFE